MKLIADALESRRCLEAHAARRPFPELGGDVLCDKDDLRGPADKLVLLGIGFGHDERQDRRAIRRRYTHPPLAGLHPSVEGHVESQLVDKEVQAAVLVAHEDIHAMKPQVRGFSDRRRDRTHARNYRAERVGSRVPMAPGTVCLSQATLVCFNACRVRKWKLTRNYEHIVG
jgi:hypothetical protein